MAHIKHQKHAVRRQPQLSQSAALTALALALPASTFAQSVQTLPEVKVSAEAEGSYKVESAASSKYTAPLVDTPKSITVVTEQVLRETNALTLQDALRTVPGITFGMGEGGNPSGDRPFIRGYDSQSATYIDGLRDPSSQSRDMFNVEQVDVVKGPDSAFSGGGAIGGSINLTSKQAHLGNSADIGLGLGTANYRRATVDVNRQLADTVALRLNVMKEDSDVAGRDEVYNDHLGAALSFNVGIGTPTRIGVDYYHYETDDLPDYGIPYNNPYAATSANAIYNGDGGPLHVDRENFYGLKDRDFRETEVDSGTLRIEHDINDKLTIRNRTRYTRSLNDYVVTNPGDSSGLNVTNGNITVGTGANTTTLPAGFLNRSSKNRHSVSEGYVNATELTGEFQTGFIKHNFATGIEFSENEVDSRGYTVTGTNINGVQYLGASFANIANPDADDAWNGTVTRATAGNKIKTNTQAAYLFDTLTLHKQWLLNVGARWDHFDTKQTPYNVDGAALTANQLRQRGKSDTYFWSWQAGLVFKPLENGSIYLNYATSANPSGITTGDGADNISAANQNLEPEETRSYELGTKWNLLDNRLSLSAALFDMKKTNAKVTVATEIMDTVGTQRIKGFELGVAGAITKQWNVSAGYTRLDSELSDPGPTAAATDKGNRFPNTPKDSFTLWSSYELMPKLVLGGGAYYMSKVYGNTANTKWVPSYWRFDAMASYEINKTVSLRLNVQNLFDKTYYDKAYSTHMVSVAPGRQAILTANLKF